MKRKGFTLIEMIITITIIVILALISIPLYKDRRNDFILAEAYALFATIIDAQETYYCDYEYFLKSTESSAKSTYWTNNEEVLGIDARGNKYFTWFCVGGSNKNDKSNSYTFLAAAVKPAEIGGGNVYLRYDITAGKTYY